MKVRLQISILVLWIACISCDNDNPTNNTRKDNKIVIQNIKSHNHPFDLLPLDSGNIWLYQTTIMDMYNNEVKFRLDTISIHNCKLMKWIQDAHNFTDYVETFDFVNSNNWPWLAPKVAKFGIDSYQFGVVQVDDNNIQTNYINWQRRLDSITYYSQSESIETPIGLLTNCITYKLFDNITCSRGIGIVKIYNEYKDAHDWEISYSLLIGFTVK